MKSPPVIVWFRRDLRLADNPALHAARESGAPVAPVFILDDEEAFAPGGAGKWWLHQSLKSLGADIEKAGGRLILRRGRAAEIIPSIADAIKASAIYWNRRYAPAHVEADKTLKAALTKAGYEVKSFSAALLREPWEVETKTGGPFRVYTPFWKALSAKGPARKALPRLRKINAPGDAPLSENLEDWRLEPRRPDWARAFGETWRPGEAGGHAALKDFLEGPAASYAHDRDMPARLGTSRLSPHLAFGEVSPVQVWQATQAQIEAGGISRQASEKFLSEIGWRDFSYSLLFYNKGMEERPLRPEFASFPWRKDPKGLAAWKKGLTGYPIVDAGMRQLWRTGWMHNRVRMIAASFLVKDLLLPWQEGARWFWDTLVDADAANNSASWQWVAGCGADAAPYFRIFNPVTQGEKFDPAGDYVREYVPELAGLPAELIHAPWKAPDAALKKADVILGQTYPNPVVDHAFARTRALEAFKQIKKS